MRPAKNNQRIKTKQEDLFDGANLSETIDQTILNLETQIRELNGSLEISGGIC